MKKIKIKKNIKKLKIRPCINRKNRRFRNSLCVWAGGTERRFHNAGCRGVVRKIIKGGPNICEKIYKIWQVAIII